MELILTKLRNIYPDLTASKRRVASYFMNNYSTVYMDTATELADKIGVSDTTIINLCSDLGFTGYNAFRKALKNEILNADSVRSSASEDVNDTDSRILKISGHLTSWIGETLTDRGNMDAMKKCAKLLGNGKKTCFIGFWVFAGLAKSSALRFLSTGYRAEAVYPDMGDYVEHLLDMEEGSVAVVFDFFKYVTALTEVCMLLRERGIPVILITDLGPCPRISMADEVIHCFCHKTDDSTPGFPMLAATSVICLLHSLILEQFPKPANEYNTGLREGVFTRFNPYGVLEAPRNYPTI